MRTVLIAFALAAAAAPAAAEVKASGETGFALEYRATVPATPSRAYLTTTRIGSWWLPSHTYSGTAANLQLEPVAGGCLCERWAGGAVEHGRVIQARPGQMLRVSAALGPLQGEAVTGVLTWVFKPEAGGTELTLTYVVGGYVLGGTAKYAVPVEQVMAQQFASLVAALGK